MDFLYALSGLKLSPSIGQEIVVQLITVAAVTAVVYLFAADRPLLQVLGVAAILVYAVGRVVAVAVTLRADSRPSER